jgi:hypothetical protein
MSTDEISHQPQGKRNYRARWRRWWRAFFDGFGSLGAGMTSIYTLPAIERDHAWCMTMGHAFDRIKRMRGEHVVGFTYVCTTCGKVVEVDAENEQEAADVG